MDDRTINAVQTSWAAVETLGPQAAALFYQNLFAADPSLKPLFKGDMAQQGAKLLQMISLAVGKLRDLDTLVPVLQALGKGHVGYGVQESHYQTVGEQLIKTLEMGLGDAFTAEVRQAWLDVYTVMADVMKAAARA